MVSWVKKIKFSFSPIRVIQFSFQEQMLLNFARGDSILKRLGMSTCCSTAILSIASPRTSLSCSHFPLQRHNFCKGQPYKRRCPVGPSVVHGGFAGVSSTACLGKGINWRWKPFHDPIFTTMISEVLFFYSIFPPKDGHKTETCSGYWIKYSNQCCVRRKPWTWCIV
jgi:hypothetical protein